MENVMISRMSIVFVIFAAVGVVALAFYHATFPVNAMISAGAIAAVVGCVYYHQHLEKSARLAVYYQAAQEHGTPLVFRNLSGAFERNGQRFEISFPQGENQAYFIGEAPIAGLNEKFSISSKVLVPKFHSDCILMKETVLGEQYIVQSRNPEFMNNLLANPAIFRELQAFDASVWRYFLLTFEDGSLVLNWSPPVAESISGFSMVAGALVRLHDELSKRATN